MPFGSLATTTVPWFRVSERHAVAAPGTILVAPPAGKGMLVHKIVLSRALVGDADCQISIGADTEATRILDVIILLGTGTALLEFPPESPFKLEIDEDIRLTSDNGLSTTVWTSVY